MTDRPAARMAVTQTRGGRIDVTCAASKLIFDAPVRATLGRPTRASEGSQLAVYPPKYVSCGS